jgi:sortase A
LTPYGRLYFRVKNVLRRIQTGKAPARLRQQASVFLISTGVSLLLLTTGAYRWMHQEQAQLMERHRLLATGAGASDAQADVTLLSIPRIKLEAAVLESTSKKSLLLAPGHLQRTAMPGGPGNAVIAGHRDTFFRHLNDLQNGDEILVTRGQRQVSYIVYSKKIVDPSDLSVTFPSSDSRLTLVTCYPTYYIGPAPKRLIVVAKRRDVSHDPAAANLFAQTRSTSATP